MEDRKAIPRLIYTKSGRIDKLELFSHYVARQLGFEDASDCPQLCRLASDYLKKIKGCEENIFALFARETDAEAFYIKLIDEFDKCILGYFGFHWTQATLMIRQVLNDDCLRQTRLKCAVMDATRKRRFDKVTRDLKVTRVFSTLLEEMKTIGRSNSLDKLDVMVPANSGERNPVLLLIGGGMGAGKSTILKDILNEPFWSRAAATAVVVEADAFKETDVIYRALSSRGHNHDMLQTAELVHQSSTDAASSLLVTALNEGRDVILDSTLSWEPFVEQTIAMARNVHRCRYRMGNGYKISDKGTITENYWEQVEEPGSEEITTENKRRPYRIELVGVVCEASLAVIRGIRRAVVMGRAVRIRSQLKSHKRFARAFPQYCELVDSTRLYYTSVIGGPPKLIGWKDGSNHMLVDQKQISCLQRVSVINEEADSVYELYPYEKATSAYESSWHDIIFSPSRASAQHELHQVLYKIEKEVEIPSPFSK